MRSINHYKLLVMDVDGTFLNGRGEISAEDKNALAKVIESGVLVSISSGRAAQACLKILNQLSLDGAHIFFDGALVSDPKKNEKVYVQPISKEVAKEVIEFAHLNEINIDLFSATRYFVERETWVSDIRRQFYGIEPKITDFNKLWQKEEIIKGTLGVRSPEERAKAEKFRRHFSTSLDPSVTKTPAYPEIDFINVVTRGVSKGKALKALARHLRIPKREIMAIGDGTNDISLLSSAGLAIAMGNAPDEVKAVADYVTLDVDSSGVAVAINRFLFNSKGV